MITQPVLADGEVREVDEVLYYVGDFLLRAGKEVMYELVVSADLCAGDNQAVAGMVDTKFSRNRSRHVPAQAVSCIFAGH
jgi:hypothetical protein